MKQGMSFSEQRNKQDFIDWLSGYTYVQKMIAIRKGCKEFCLSIRDSIDIFNTVYADIEF